MKQIVSSACVLLAACAAPSEKATPATPATSAARPQAASPGAKAFDARFTGRTLRFDYYHSGDVDDEHIALDRFRLEGEWPGSRTQLVDPTGYGKYRFLVSDLASGEQLWTRGFASIYGEWETTGEAASMWRTFHESQRFPEPRAPVKLVLEKRTDAGEFVELWKGECDPASRFVDRSAVAPEGTLTTLLENGPPATKVDLLFLGDGYTAAQRERFLADVKRLTGVLFDTEPWKHRKADFNVRAVHLPAAEAGISNPRAGVWRDSPLSLSFNAFDSDRYVLTYANATLREVAAQAPYDALILCFNERKYGGGGIYGLWCTNSAASAEAPYLLVHELGHSFAALADEYYTSPVAYEEAAPQGVEPWDPNVTALVDPEKLKWRDMIEPGTALPTPWNQEAYDKVSLAHQARRAEMLAAGASEEQMEALFREVKEATAPMLKGEQNFGRVGAFQGAAYQAQGLYRPEVDCLMFTRNPSSYCRVCTRAIERVIDLYAD